MQDKLFGKTSLVFLWIAVFTILNRVLWLAGIGNVLSSAAAYGIAFILATISNCGIDLTRHSRQTLKDFLMPFGIICFIQMVFPMISMLAEQGFNMAGLTLHGTMSNNIPVNEDMGFFTYLGVIILMAFLEEVLFRGMALHSLQKEMNAGMAVLLSALAFGLSHGQADRFLDTFLSGIVFGVIYLRHGIWASWGMHCVTNLVLGLLDLILPQNIFNTYVDGIQVLYIAFFAIGTSLMLKRKEEIAEWLKTNCWNGSIAAKAASSAGFLALLAFSIYRMAGAIDKL